MLVATASESFHFPLAEVLWRHYPIFSVGDKIGEVLIPDHKWIPAIPIQFLDYVLPNSEGVKGYLSCPKCTSPMTSSQYLLLLMKHTQILPSFSTLICLRTVIQFIWVLMWLVPYNFNIGVQKIHSSLLIRYQFCMDYDQSKCSAETSHVLEDLPLKQMQDSE